MKATKRIVAMLLCILLVLSFVSCEKAQGIPGEKGEQGLQGEKGEQGIQGIPGEKGPQGIQGIPGEKGPQGIQGIPGTQGIPGENGLSAYELFIKYYKDYLGTEQEWVLDLAKGLLLKEHQITFDSQGGAKVEPQKVLHRYAFPKDVKTEREGYIFRGWFADTACKEPVKVVADDITVYAGWIRTDEIARLESAIYHTGFRGAEGYKGVFDAKTPVSADNVKLDWEVKLATSWSDSPGFPIEVGDYIYIAKGNQLQRLDKATGAVLRTVALKARIGFFSSIAYGDGKIFVPVANGIIQAFDELTMESLWISETPKDNTGKPLRGQQSLSPVTYNDGYIYCGITYGNAKTGAFFCLSTKDEDPNLNNELKPFTWCYVPEQKGGFYWSEGVVIGNCIAFAGEAGILYTHSLKGNEKNEDGSIKFIDSLVLPGEAEAVRSSLAYDETSGRVLITTKAGNIHSVKVKEDGTIEKTSLITKFICADITSSPVTYRGRVYLGGGGISSSAGITVFDAATLNIIYECKDIRTQSSPVITTAYATAENNYTVYAYFLSYTNPDAVYVLKDFQGNTTPNLVKLIDSPHPQYNSSSIAIGNDGALYYKNDSGYLFRFVCKNDNSFTSQDVDNAIALLSDTVKTRADEIAVIRAKYRLDNLSQEEQAKVKGKEKLDGLYSKLK